MEGVKPSAAMLLTQVSQSSPASAPKELIFDKPDDISGSHWQCKSNWIQILTVIETDKKLFNSDINIAPADDMVQLGNGVCEMVDP